MIGETGERKSAVATPDGKSRKKKKKKNIADRHWCISRVTIGGTPCIEPNSHQAYCSKKALHKPDTTSFIIRTAVLTGGFLPHASRRLLTPLTPFLFSLKL